MKTEALKRNKEAAIKISLDKNAEISRMVRETAAKERLVKAAVPFESHFEMWKESIRRKKDKQREE